MRNRGLVRLDGEAGPGGRVEVRGPALESLKLWGPRAGEAVTVVGPGGRLSRARVIKLGPEGAELALFEDMGLRRDPPVEITLLQALPEKERMELIIEKTTELGVGRIVPFESARSTSLAERESAQPKAHRWAARALKAARQSRREEIPEVLPCTDLAGALKEARAGGGADLKVALYEGAGAAPLKGALSGANLGEVESVAVLTGPEGGFTAEEIKTAEGAGFTPVSLGPRILRTETAAIAAVAILAYELGW